MANVIKKDILHAKGFNIGIYTTDYENEFISITDIARYKSDDPTAVIQNWMRNRDVIEFLGLWKRLYNPDFTSWNSRGLESRQSICADNEPGVDTCIYIWRVSQQRSLLRKLVTNNQRSRNEIKGMDKKIQGIVPGTGNRADCG